MSEQPPSRAPKAMIAASALWLRSVLDDDDIGALLSHIENMTDERPLVADCEPSLGGRDLRLAHQEEVGVIGRQRVVERRLDRVARAGRTHEAWRDNDGEVGLVLL